MRGRFWILAIVSISLALHAFVVGHALPSAFFVASYAWGWIAVAALLGRLEDIRSMAATMVVLLLASALIVVTTPLGHGDTSGYFSLAWFPSLVAFGCVYVYAIYLQRSDATPNVSFDAALANAWSLSDPRDIEKLRMEAEAFARQMTETAAGREQRGTHENVVAQEDGTADVNIPTFAVSKVA